MEGYSTCYSHREDLAEERRRNASRGGKRGGRGRGSQNPEVAELKRRASDLYTAVLEGEIPPAVGAVGVQCLNCQTRLWESERRVRLAESGVVTPEQMEEDVRQVASIITRHVKDKGLLELIRSDLRRADERRDVGF